MNWWCASFLAFIQLNPWKVVGLSGSIIFGLRFFLQWIASERARKSIIPVGFWECSLLGSVLTFSYFAFYRHDSVGVLITVLPMPLYARNLYFKYRELAHHRNQRAAPVEPVETMVER